MNLVLDIKNFLANIELFKNEILSSLGGALTKGSILFISDDGVTENNANLFWDDTNKRLGIGTTSPDGSLDVIGDCYVDTGYLTLSNDVAGANYTFDVNNTATSATNNRAGNNFNAKTTDGVARTMMSFRCVWSDNNATTRTSTIDFRNIDNATAFNTLQLVGKNATFINDLTITGNTIFSKPARLKSYTVATLPTGTQGDIAFVTDALVPVFLTTIAAGGAVVTPVFYNGTNWVAY